MSGKWKPGQSGNPAGRPPKGKSWAEISRAIGDEIVGRGRAKDDSPRRVRVLRKVWKLAEDGERWAVEFLALREEGPPIAFDQTVESDIEVVGFKFVLASSADNEDDNET